MATSGMGNYFENLILNWLCKGGSVPATPGASGTIFVALFTSALSGPDSFVNEVTNANGYVRQGVAVNNWNFTAGGSGTPASMSNSLPITFPLDSGGNWGNITYVAITTTATYGSGNIYYWGALTSAQQVNAGSTFSFAAGSLVINLQ